MNNESIHPLRKGDDVYTAVIKPFQLTGYAHDSRIEVMHGKVTGGGEDIAIIDWDGHRQAARYPRHRLSAKSFDMTREAALRRLGVTLIRAVGEAQRQIEIAYRLQTDLVALLEAKPMAMTVFADPLLKKP